MTETICRIGAFVLCAQMLVHFRPKPVYEKYFRLVVSAMLLAQLLQPFLDLWGGGERLDQRVASYTRILEQSLTDAANGSRETARLLEERLKEQGFAMEEELPDAQDIRIEWESVDEIGEIIVE